MTKGSSIAFEEASVLVESKQLKGVNTLRLHPIGTKKDFSFKFDVSTNYCLVEYEYGSQSHDYRFIMVLMSHDHSSQSHDLSNYSTMYMFVHVYPKHFIFDIVINYGTTEHILKYLKCFKFFK